MGQFDGFGRGCCADALRPPVIGGAAPVIVGDGGCAACQGGTATGSCSKCGSKCAKIVAKKGYYQVNLCPGACFGYFQTQWRKWDEVCPYPYLGQGVNDAPRLPGSPTTAPNPCDLTPQRPIDPRKLPDPKKVGSLVLPTIPTVPAPNKFGR